MTEVVSYRPVLEQHGYADSGGSWNALDLPEDTVSDWDIPGLAVYSQIYDFELNLDAVTGLSFRDRLFFTQASQSQLYTITIPTTMNTEPGQTFSISTRTAVTPELWSDTLHPSLGYTDGATYTTDQSWVLNGAVYDLVIPADFNTQFDTTAVPRESVQLTQNKPLWNGRLVVIIQELGSAGYTITNPLTAYRRGFCAGQYVPTFSGIDGRPAEAGRPVLDMKTGFPRFAEDMVEDCYHDGIWTTAAQWDPRDPRDVREVVFPDDEGTRKDDVPA